MSGVLSATIFTNDDENMNEPINPVTFRGTPSNISVGRLWVGADYVRDGQNRSIVLEKSMQFVIWSDPNEPQGVFYLDEEIDFINAIHVARDGKIVQLKGYTHRTEGIPRTLEIHMAAKQEKVGFRLKNENGKSFAFVFVEREHFDRGLGHLFPSGEMS